MAGQFPFCHKLLPSVFRGSTNANQFQFSLIHTTHFFHFRQCLHARLATEVPEIKQNVFTLKLREMMCISLRIIQRAVYHVVARLYRFYHLKISCNFTSYQRLAVSFRQTCIQRINQFFMGILRIGVPIEERQLITILFQPDFCDRSRFHVFQFPQPNFVLQRIYMIPTDRINLVSDRNIIYALVKHFIYYHLLLKGFHHFRHSQLGKFSLRLLLRYLTFYRPERTEHTFTLNPDSCSGNYP